VGDYPVKGKLKIGASPLMTLAGLHVQDGDGNRIAVTNAVRVDVEPIQRWSGDLMEVKGYRINVEAIDLFDDEAYIDSDAVEMDEELPQPRRLALPAPGETSG
jgi:hypothetical protein